MPDKVNGIQLELLVKAPSGGGYFSIALNQAAITSLFLCSGYRLS
jgi:hypothetical protein